MANIDKYQDVIDVRDIIARVEELEAQDEQMREHVSECEEAYSFHDSDDTQSTPEWSDLQGARTDLANWGSSEDFAELAMLRELLESIKGYGGDEQWRGDWYPITLIRDSYFESYAQELAEDIGAIKDDATWPNNCIDWERAARELQTDYTSVEYDGVTYWTR